MLPVTQHADLVLAVEGNKLSMISWQVSQKRIASSMRRIAFPACDTGAEPMFALARSIHYVFGALRDVTPLHFMAYLLTCSTHIHHCAPEIGATYRDPCSGVDFLVQPLILRIRPTYPTMVRSKKGGFFQKTP